MKNLILNLVEDKTTMEDEGKSVYAVSIASSSSVSGFSNAFNKVFELSDKIASEIENTLANEGAVYAYHDARFKCGFRFESY